VRHNGAFATFDSQPASNHAVFIYYVLEGHWSNDLDLSDGQNMYFQDLVADLVLRESAFPVTPANLTLPSVILSTLPSFVVDGRRPSITKVQYADEQEEIIGLGDTLNVELHFSSPVILVKGAPILVLNAGNSYQEALYDTGNQTSMLRFKYLIEVGDHSSSELRIKMLCVESGCLEGGSREGYILQNSANPSINADLRLPVSSSRSGENE